MKFRLSRIRATQPPPPSPPPPPTSTSTHPHAVLARAHPHRPAHDCSAQGRSRDAAEARVPSATYLRKSSEPKEEEHRQLHVRLSKSSMDLDTFPHMGGLTPARPHEQGPPHQCASTAQSESGGHQVSRQCARAATARPSSRPVLAPSSRDAPAPVQPMRSSPSRIAGVPTRSALASSRNANAQSV